MPAQAPQWMDYLKCPVCCRDFGAAPRSPISLSCGHTICRICLKHMLKKKCPFDQTFINLEAEEMVMNTALLLLAGYTPPVSPYHPPCIQLLNESEIDAYDTIVKCMEHLAVFLKYCCDAGGSTGNKLSRSMQRKLVTLLQCSFTDEEGRARVARAARSLGERTVTEFILLNQNPHLLSSNLWATVRARGCQFLGPAMQEEVLKLVLLALEDGSALSRKVLVMFVVQSLEPHFPQASKTSIGHVVQLLYRASCFRVSKRDSDSSLMQLKEDFRTYETLRREHDTQIVQIATEAGLRIAPDQWSSLLYGDTSHKSHMHSIIDKLQSPQSFTQSVEDLLVILQRTGDDLKFLTLYKYLSKLTAIDINAKIPNWQQLADILMSLEAVVSFLVHFVTRRDSNQGSQTTPTFQTSGKYKVTMCRDALLRSFCPRGEACTYAHSEEEMERYRSASTKNNNIPTSANLTFVTMPASIGVPTSIPTGIPLPPQIYPAFPIPQRIENYPPPALATIPPPSHGMHPEMIPIHNNQIPMENLPSTSFAPTLIHPQPIGMAQNTIMIPVADGYYGRFPGMMALSVDPNIQYRTDYPVYQPGPSMQFQMAEAVPLPSIYIPVHEAPRNISPYAYDEMAPNFRVPPPFVPVPRAESAWTPTNDVYNTQRRRNPLHQYSGNATEHAFQVPAERRASGAERTARNRSVPASGFRQNRSEDMFNAPANRRGLGSERLDRSVPPPHYGMNAADDQQLEEELQALERRIDSEFESAD